MSPRAACRLERMGFEVYDYAAGKVDWIAAGSPTEGTRDLDRRVLMATDRDVPTCTPDETIEVIRRRLAPRTHVCVVVDEDRVVLGRIHLDRLDPLSDTRTADDVLEPGPVTIRAHEDLEATRQRMRRRNVEALIVTSPQGKLLGLLRRG